MGKLTDMQVGRVDGVDKPAIRKRWVLVKSEDAATVEKDYAGAAAALVEAIAKEGVSFSDETVEVLRALVDLLELDIDFAQKSEDETSETAETTDEEKTDDDEKTDDETPEGEDDVEKTTYTAEEAEALVAKALAAAGVDTSKLVEGDVVKSEDDVKPLRVVTKSRQPKEQGTESGTSRTVKKGEGLFANIVHGKSTEPYRG